MPAQRPPGPFLSAVGCVLGLILIVVAAVGLHRDRRTPTAFSAPTQAVAPTARAPLSPSQPVLRSEPAASTAIRQPAGTDPPGIPTELSLPSLDVRAAVRPVITTGGVLGVPDDIADVGWWTGSARPGSATGSTVIDGHVDSAVTGTGALFHLSELRAGDPVTITDIAGVPRRYRVYAREIYVKHDGLPPTLFTTTGPPRLVIITCGGPFDTSTRNYLDNIIVLATPT